PHGAELSRWKPPAPGLAARPASNLLRRPPDARRGIKIHRRSAAWGAATRWSSFSADQGTNKRGGAKRVKVESDRTARQIRQNELRRCPGRSGPPGRAAAPAASTADGKAAAAQAEQAERGTCVSAARATRLPTKTGLDSVEGVDEHWPVEADKRYIALRQAIHALRQEVHALRPKLRRPER
uniref:Enkurin domain-containing protein n=1 Tax=Macrostomum lignano TaxID=282301 RepID=A0A1I8FSL2_9PLAT